MIIITVLVIGISVLGRDIRKLNQADQLKVFGMALIYIAAMIYYVSFINAQSNTFGYGIPGADMLAHYQGAEKLSKGFSWVQLSSVASRFEKVGVSTIGYFIYTNFISLCIFTLPVFSTGVNVYLVYAFQILVSLDTALRFGHVVASEHRNIREIQVFLSLALCAPFMVQSFQLMRDIYYMWAIVSLLFVLCQLKENKTFAQKRVWVYLKCGLLFVMAVMLRYYSLVLIIPLMLYYSEHKKIAVYVVLGELVVLIFGSNVIDIVKQIIGLPWTISSPEISESIKFLLFPNIFNQSKYLLHWRQFFGTGIDVSGCNVPGVYYIMSVWNLWILPLAGVGVLTNWKEKKKETFIWVGILISIVMIYSITYDAIDTRHKFFMSLPLCYLAAKGSEKLRKRIPCCIYNLTVCATVLIVLVAFV